MRLVSYGERGRERAALWLDLPTGEAGAVDVARASEWLGLEPRLPSDPQDLLRQGLLGPAAELARRLEQRLASAGTAGLPAGVYHPRGSVRLGPPVPRPPQMVCLGLNYRDHAREQGKEPPSRPLLFAKSPAAVIGPEDEIQLEPELEQVDYELELGVVIGREASRIRAAEALDHVAGYTIFLDISDREAQYSDKQWYRGKSHDTFAPCGPWLTAAARVADPGRLAMELRVNGEVRQHSSTAEMIFSVPEILAYITRTITLQPGDLVATGTPAGVGVFRQPPVFLRPGDLLQARIEGLGELETRVALRPRG